MWEMKKMTQVFRQEQLEGVTCVLRKKLCILEARKRLGLNKRSELVSNAEPRIGFICLTIYRHQPVR